MLYVAAADGLENSLEKDDDRDDANFIAVVSHRLLKSLHYCYLPDRV